MIRQKMIIIGSGIFGVTAAIELRRRGHAVQLLDPGPLPHPLAAYSHKFRWRPKVRLARNEEEARFQADS